MSFWLQHSSSVNQHLLFCLDCCPCARCFDSTPILSLVYWPTVSVVCSPVFDSLLKACLFLCLMMKSYVTVCLLKLSLVFCSFSYVTFSDLSGTGPMPVVFAFDYRLSLCCVVLCCLPVLWSLFWNFQMIFKLP